jgi:hypothetical protein
MSDDFGTVNVRRGERGKEIEAVRQQYRHHRDALVRMVADAPTEHLAAEYQKLIREIDTSIVKLDEIEGRPATSAGTRPLVTTTPADEQETLVTDNIPASASEPSQQSSRVLMIVIAGVIVLAAILWLLWRASGDRSKVVEQPNTVTTPVVETTTTAATTATATVPEAVAASALKVTPLAANYGTIRKGTRAVRQFSIENTSGAAVKLNLARSTCKCLFYEYPAQGIPAHGKDKVTVTIDGARAKTGALHETVHVMSKSDPSDAAQFDVNATIQ